MNCILNYSTNIKFKNMSVLRRYQLKHSEVKDHDVCNLLSNGSLIKIIIIERGREKEGEKRRQNRPLPRHYTACSICGLLVSMKAACPSSPCMHLRASASD